MTFPELVTNALYSLPVLWVSFVVHEYAHALVATRLGGTVVDWERRLTLDPRAHLEPIGAVVMPLLGLFAFGFPWGWAKPVAWTPPTRGDLRAASRWVSAAGPLANVLLMIFFATLSRALSTTGLLGVAVVGEALRGLLFWGVYLNAFLAVFNLIPLPPLDGSKVLASFLPSAKAWRLLTLSPGLSFLLVLVALRTPLVSVPLKALISLARTVAG